MERVTAESALESLCLGGTTAAPPAPGGLSQRELEVLRLRLAAEPEVAPTLEPPKNLEVNREPLTH